ncbi:ATP-binding cassette domain-containing protein [Armatimonas rosea]|uniref:ABC-type polysaccharide/polyol phosphate transport system ATPase subunit n=1 Tax=Armatimonas rosea TaxID=685828 RepID=A0A7W9W6E4_ARMRO|nr:ABC-type polysaccharide/polyol phosphate transport system ATPase subunit [Armatimonas rosea]
MSEPALVVEKVSKRFARNTAQGDLRERFARQLRGEKQPKGSFLALDDVSFVVHPGQPVGIIGHNGSGKSTLLKLLTGILKPTEGTVAVHGRVGALIEVGAGFHPDLSGRENVFLAGSILGLSRQQVHERYDRIVDFAGLADFMETPVKRYSSGMYMRLGFAIVAHLDPEILLIDEVLAVGDALFQNKCLRFLKDFVKKGGTVCFVSHSLGQVELLCETCVWLDHGKARFIGPTAEAIAHYHEVIGEREDAEFARLYPVEWEAQQEEKRRVEEEARQEAERVQREAEEAERAEQERLAALEAERAAAEALLQAAEAERKQDPNRARLTHVTLRDSQGVPRTSFKCGDRLSVEIAWRSPKPLPEPAIGFDIFDTKDNQHLFTTSNYDHQISFAKSQGEGVLHFTLPFLALPAGEYRVQVNLYPDSTQPEWSAAPEDQLDDAVRFTVTHERVTHGRVFLPVEWERPA